MNILFQTKKRGECNPVSRAKSTHFGTVNGPITKNKKFPQFQSFPHPKISFDQRISKIEEALLGDNGLGAVTIEFCTSTGIVRLYVLGVAKIEEAEGSAVTIAVQSFPLPKISFDRFISNMF